MKKYSLLIAVYFFLLGPFIATAEFTSGERHRLYTEPDPSNSGGLKGRMIKPDKPIEQILAISPDEPRFVYKGKITGDDKQGFLFENLPPAKFDLFVIYEDSFYEGMALNKNHKSTLTSDDLKKINTILTESQPYFTRKVLHRVEGETGRGNFARVVLTMLRDKASSDGRTDAHDWRRTFKLTWLKQVGPGWQVVQSRDLYPVWVDPVKGYPYPKHNYKTVLSGIRVADTIKDVGNLDLSKENSSASLVKDKTPAVKTNEPAYVLPPDTGEE
jgi:hypothetical protein